MRHPPHELQADGDALRGRIDTGRRRASWRESRPDGVPATDTGDALPLQARDSGTLPAGGAVTAVLVPGLGLSSRFYDGSYAAFAAAGIRLVVPDLPGWGDTPGPLTGLSPEATVDFLEEFAGALGIGRAIWIGHSLGAQAVVELAVRRPGLAQALVLVGPTGSPRPFELLRQAGALLVEATRISRHVLRGVVRDYVRTPPTRYFGTWIRHGRHRLTAQLRQVSCPVLILVGDRDPVCQPPFVRMLARFLPDARVEQLRGGTHALPRGCVREFNQRTTAFIREATP